MRALSGDRSLSGDTRVYTGGYTVKQAKPISLTIALIRVFRYFE